MRYSLAATVMVTCAAASPSAPQLKGPAAPVAAPYDTHADAHAEADAAFARARATGHLVMLDFGGNWCPDCRILAGILAQPELQAWRSQHYETVLIDIGRRDKNVDIAARWGVKIIGVPTVLIVSAEGKLLNRNNVYALSGARSMPQQAIVDLLASWQTADPL